MRFYTAAKPKAAHGRRDSVKDFLPKGTGNSRYLKSALPPGTTWEQVLTMLILGTFPVDFNGINANGIVDRGTPLNKANLLKDATAQRLGLTPANNPTIDDAFNALQTTANQIDENVSDLSSLLYQTPSGDLELRGNNVNFVTNGKVTKNGIEIGGANAGYQFSYGITLPIASSHTETKTVTVPPDAYLKISTDKDVYESGHDSGFRQSVEVTYLSRDNPTVSFVFKNITQYDEAGKVEYTLSGTDLTVKVVTYSHADFGYRIEFNALVEVFTYHKKEITVTA